MGKRKVGTLYNKPVVEGDENLITKNELLVNAKNDLISIKKRSDSGDLTSITLGGEGSSDSEFLYYKIKQDDIVYYNSKGEKQTIRYDDFFPIFFDAFTYYLPSCVVYDGKIIEWISGVYGTTANPLSTSGWTFYQIPQFIGTPPYKPLYFALQKNTGGYLEFNNEGYKYFRFNSADPLLRLQQILNLSQEVFEELIVSDEGILYSWYEPVTKEEFYTQIKE